MSELPLGLGDAERLDHVADLEIIVVLEAYAALEAGLDFADVVLEPAQRADAALEDLDAVADESDPVVARDRPVLHEASADVADARNLEHLAHLHRCRDLFLAFRGKHALQRVADVVDGIVDD